MILQKVKMVVGFIRVSLLNLMDICILDMQSLSVWILELHANLVVWPIFDSMIRTRQKRKPNMSIRLWRMFAGWDSTGMTGFFTPPIILTNFTISQSAWLKREKLMSIFKHLRPSASKKVYQPVQALIVPTEAPRLKKILNFSLRWNLDFSMREIVF